MMFDNGFASYMIKFNMVENQDVLPTAYAFKVQRNWAIVCLLGICILCGVAIYNSARIHKGNATAGTIKFHDYADQSYDYGYNASKLPASLLPVTYKLYLNPMIETKSYSGYIETKILCQHSTPDIILHSAQHKVKGVQLKNKDKVLEIDGYYRNGKGILALKMKKNLTVGNEYDLRIDFDNNLDVLRSGIYLDRFVDGNGKTSELMTTNFAHKDARTAWPCFDEPELKASWEIIVKHPKTGFNVISNMPVQEKVAIDDGHVETKFTVTPKISSSDVAVVVTPYEFQTISSPLKFKINVYAPAGRLNETNFAIKLAPLAADIYAENLRMNYPSSKLDLVPYPVLNSDVKPSLGLIPAVESLLLYNSSTTSVKGLEEIAEKILHEISKQWLGNIVDGTWVEKALASYMKGAALQKFFPSWNLDTKFYSSIVDMALDKDKEYNAITPEKGTALINMLAKMLGDDALYKGLRVYLNKYKVHNTSVDQLWKALTEVTPSIDVNSFMSSWTNQSGFPLITLKLEGNKLSIQQQTFQHKNSSLATNQDDSIWQVPITIKLCGKVIHFTLKKRSEKFLVDVDCADKTFKANYGGNGYYRVNYDDKTWMKLVKSHNTKYEVLPAVDRGNLLADLYSLVRHNHVNVKQLLDFTQYLSKEHEFVPWEIGSKILTNLLSTFDDATLSNCIEEYTVKLVQPVTDYLDTFKTHSHPQKKLVVLMLNLALKLKMEPVTSELQTIFWKWMLSKGNTPIPAYIREPIIRAGVMSGKVKQWNFILKMYENAKSVSEKKMLLRTLTYTSNADLLERLIKYVMNFEHKVDRVSVLADICANPAGRGLAWKAVKVEWKSIEDSSSPDSVTHLLKECLGSRSSGADLTEAKAFKSSVKSSTGKYVDQVIKRIELNVEMRKKEKDVALWFQDNYPRCFNRN